MDGAWGFTLGGVVSCRLVLCCAGLIWFGLVWLRLGLIKHGVPVSFRLGVG